MKYSLASSTWDEKEKKAMLEVMDSGLYTMGPNVLKYEKNFADFFGSKYAVMVNSGSSANLLTIAALFYRNTNPLKFGDEVIVPAVSWPTSFHPLQQHGLHCRFVDIDKDTLNYDLNALRNAITDNTKIILVVNLLGNPNNFEEIYRIIGNRNIIIIEDNCESMGARYSGKMAGTFALMGTFSSFFSHHISTMEGGMIVTDDEELYHILISLRAHGWTRNLPKFNHITGEKSDNLFEESFKFVLPGYNVRPGEMNGAIGIEQLKKLSSFIEMRRKNAEHFIQLFANHPYLRIQKEIGESSWFGFSIVIKENAPYTRNQLVELLTKNNIECRPIVSGNFLKNLVMKYYNYSIAGEVTNAEWIDLNGLFIGNHHFELFEEIEFVSNLLRVK